MQLQGTQHQACSSRQRALCSLRQPSPRASARRQAPAVVAHASGHHANDAKPSPWKALVTSGLGVLATALMLVPSFPPPALAELPPGKAQVSGQQLVDIVREDFEKRRYLVTGDMTFNVYADDTHFIDSNNDFGKPGVEKWAATIKSFLDGDKSKMALTGPVVLDEAERTITFTGWKMVNFYRLPACPHTGVFSGRTILKLDPVENIITEHYEVWDDPPSEVVKGLKFFDCDYNPAGFD